MVDALVMPSGKIIPPFAVTGIPAKVMERLHTSVIQQFQIVQEERDKINIYVVMDGKNEEKEMVIKEIKKDFERKLGEDVKINVIEVDEIESDTLIPREVVSMVKMD